MRGRSLNQYSWRPGARFGKVDANRVGRQLEALTEARGGKLSAEDVVQDATKPLSPLHECFEWDDKKAGHNYRLQQARWLMRSVQVTIKEPGPTENQTLVLMTHMSPDEDAPAIERAYVPTRRVLSNEETRDRLIRQAYQALQRVQAQYRQVEELADVWAAIDAFELPKAA